MATMTQPQSGEGKKRFIPKIDAGKKRKLFLRDDVSQWRLP